MSATASILPLPRAVFYSQGVPLAGGSVFTYIPNTTTPKTTWQDAGETTPNENPIPLDAAGSCLLYGYGSYSILVTDALGNQIPAYSGLAQDTGFNEFIVNGGTVGGALTVNGALTVDGSLAVDGAFTASGTSTLGGNVTIHGSIAETGGGVFTNTQMNLGASFLLNGISPATEYGAEQTGNFATQALVGGVAVPANSTVHEVDAVMGYANTSSATTNAVGGCFYSRGLVAGAQLFGTNVLVDDNGLASTVIGCEWDIGGKNPGSTVYGNNMIGVFPNGTPGTAVGYQVSALSGFPWGYAFFVPDGGAVVGLQLGALAATPNANSQTINLVAKDSANTDREVGISASYLSAGANMNFNTPTGGVVMSAAELTTGLGTFGAAISVMSAATTLADFYSGATFVGSISTNGTTTSYNTTSDRRLKTIHGPSGNDVIDRLKVYSGSFKDRPDVTRSMLIADEVQEVAPWAVRGDKDEVHGEDVLTPTGRVLCLKGAIKPQMVDYLMFVPDLISKCQRQDLEIATLKAQLSHIVELVTGFVKS